MKRKLTRIEPLSAGKILGLMYAAGALLFAPFVMGAMVLSALVPSGGDAPPLPVMLGIGSAICVGAPLFYGVIGFISGALGGLLYNLLAKWIGGIEFEVE